MEFGVGHQDQENPLAAALARLDQTVRENPDKAEANRLEREGTEGGSRSSLRRAPRDDRQQDFFCPPLYDVATKDAMDVMDVAVFKLSKREKRANAIMTFQRPDGYVEVKSGPDGMASVWDYDLVLMTISHLTAAMNAYRDGRGEKPGRVFRPEVSDILKFCRRSIGGRQYEEIEGALDRLKNTTVKIVRHRKGKGSRIMREAEAEGLISNYRVLSSADNGHVMSIEIEIAAWTYRRVVEAERPEVLTVHPDFFLIDGGIARFVYRLGMKASGNGMARWSFRKIYENSGSTGTSREFNRILRKLIDVNDLPEMDLKEEAGKEGPILVIKRLDLASEPEVVLS